MLLKYVRGENMLNFAWKIFNKIYSNFVLQNQSDIKELIKSDFSGVEKIKDIVYDNIFIRTDLMQESDKIYQEQTIVQAYSIIKEKVAKNESLSVFETNLYKYVMDKFDRFKLLKTVFLSIYFTILLTIASIIVSIILFLIG